MSRRMKAISAIGGAISAAATAARRWCGVHITAWRVLYWLVAGATFRHSMIGFATLEHGNLLLGALSAMAVDAGLLLAAERIRDRATWALGIGLFVAAFGSVYSQLLYSVTNASSLAVAPGAWWLGDVALYLIRARVVVLPLLLPVQVVVYAFASKVQESAVLPPVQSPVRIETGGAGAVSVAPVAALTDMQARILAIYSRKPKATQEEVGQSVGLSRSRVGQYLNALEAAGAIHRNGNGVEIIARAEG